MKNFSNITLACLSTLVLIGCGDNYNDKNEASPSQLKTLDRELSFLVDTNQMSLYTFDKDGLNKSNCDADCRKIWPIFAGANTTNTDIKVLEGTDHLAYRKHPLYFFHKDTAVGDILGNNIKDVWHLVFTPLGSNDTQTEFSDTKVTQTYLTDKNGRSLYTFDKDTKDVSNCYDATPTANKGCESTWPVFYAKDLGVLPAGTSTADFGTLERNATKAKAGESLQQTTYKGQALYYFTPDAKKSAVTSGDWVKGVWHLVEINSKKANESSPYTAQAAEKGKAIFTNPAKCARCHGADGQTPPLGVDNVIAKYGDAKLIDQKLRDMRDNANPQNRGDIMVGIAKGLSDEAIVNLSAFIATLKK